MPIAIEDLCNGSTPDSDSVCGGSNPSSPAKKKNLQSQLIAGFFFAYQGFPAFRACHFYGVRNTVVTAKTGF